jgi:CHAD domain-containing protein
MIDTLDELITPVDDLQVLDSVARVRAYLVDRRQKMSQDMLQDEDVMGKTAASIEKAQARIDSWEILHQDFSAVSGGLKRGYTRGRQAMKNAYTHPSVETFHEWRKRVKALWYHCRILRPIWPDVLDGLANTLDTLAHDLGHEHDLAELRQTLLEYPEFWEDKHAAEALLSLIQHRQAELQQAVHPVGGQIYAEKPKAFVKRFSVYWRCWREA